MKQRQREHLQTITALKVENENLIVHADEEIKRMGEFVDKYTQEVQLTKRQMEEEFEQRINKERAANEELKAKLHREQQEIDQKLDKLQREVEITRQENLSLKQEKAQVYERQKDLTD